MGRKKSKKNRKSNLGRNIWIFLLSVMILSVLFRLADLGEYFRPEQTGFQVEVLNGTGEKNLAAKTTRMLRRMGIDVLIEGNAEAFDFERSIIIDRKGDMELAESLAKRIGCERVIQQIQKRPNVDMTLVIGGDYGRLCLEE